MSLISLAVFAAVLVLGLPALSFLALALASLLRAPGARTPRAPGRGRRDSAVVLGVPVDSLTLGSAVEDILSMVTAFKLDGRPRHVVTVNVDFIVNTMGWSLSRVRHPELLEILRLADLVTADGMPVVWASRLLGHPLPERVAGADLVPLLAGACVREGRSLFLLGGRMESAREAARVLESRHPGLRLAGIAWPRVFVEGEELGLSEQEDETLVSAINQARPDILLIALGNPKQEIWFHRNRHRLKAAVSMGVGGTFEFLAGMRSRAPAWMGRAGLEWAWRLAMEPRLFKRYLTGMAKFGYLVWPAILNHHWSRLHLKTPSLLPAKREAATPPPQNKPLLLPKRLDASSASGTTGRAEARLAMGKGLVLDFSAVEFVDSRGLGVLVSLWRQAREGNLDLRFRAVPDRILPVFRLTRTLDLFRPLMEKPPSPLQDRESQPAGGFAWEIDDHRPVPILRLTGRLDASTRSLIDQPSVLAAAHGRGLVVDLEGLSFVDSTGLGLLVGLVRKADNGSRIVLAAARPQVVQVLKVSRLDRFFRRARDVETAKKMILEEA